MYILLCEFPTFYSNHGFAISSGMKTVLSCSWWLLLVSGIQQPFVSVSVRLLMVPFGLDLPTCSPEERHWKREGCGDPGPENLKQPAATGLGIKVKLKVI